MSESEEKPSPQPPSKEDLKLALKAFRKRLKLTRLDDESRLGYGPMTSGGKSGVVAITPPNQFSDGYPVLVTSSASLDALNDKLVTAGHAPVGIERFRPNIVLGGLEPHDEDRLKTIEIATESAL